MDLLSPDTGTIFWTVITFVLLLAILKKFAWKPMLHSLEARENQINQAINKAVADQAAAAKLITEQTAMLETARRESAKIIAESQQSAEKFRKEMLDQSRMEADRILERARLEIDLSKQAAISEVRQNTIDLTLAVAEKLLGEKLSREQHLQFIKKQIQTLSLEK
ncbi:F0F1 ATP synthase subunit B [candidate division KSB1 bacterium]|nr:F0F1 ATP synthase subunit B [candidate division KSB1 bacterium]